MFSERVLRGTAVIVALSLWLCAGCVIESKSFAAPKFGLVNATGVDVDVYFLPRDAGLQKQEPLNEERAHSLSPSRGHEARVLLEKVDSDEDGCLDKSIAAYESRFDRSEQPGRLVDWIPAGTCWGEGPGSQRVLTLQPVYP